MKLTIFLIVLVALLLGGQGWYLNGKSAEYLAQAEAKLPWESAEGLTILGPTFRYSNLLTLGSVGRRHRAFATSIRDAVVGRCGSGEKLDAPWFTVVVRANLRVLLDMEKTHGIETREERLAILNALREFTPAIRDRQHLSAWRGLCDFVRDAESEPAVPLDGMSDFESWRAEVLGTEIRPIALRQGSELGIKCLEDSRAAVATEPVAGTRLARLVKPSDPDAISAATRHCDAGQQAISAAMAALKSPGEVDPELRGVWIRLSLNRMSMFLGHMIDLGPEGRHSGSSLLYDLYLRPDTEVIPSAAEMYGSFSNAILGGLTDIVARIEAGFLEGRADEAELHALALWTLAQYWNTVKNRDQVARTYGKFQAVQGSASAAPEGAALISELLKGEYVYIIED